MSRRIIITLVSLFAVVALLAIGVVASGARFFTVMTPSMGQTAPVGTLVVTLPQNSYHVGEIVTYERNGRSYTHRIISAVADGTFVTKGDLNNSPDALPVAASEIVGRADWILPGFGWLWQGLPWLIVGGILVYLLSLIRNLDRSWRWVVRISGWTLAATLVAIWLRPWVSLSMLGYTPAVGGGADMHVVNTGLFPLDVLGHRLVSGQDTVVLVTQTDSQGRYTLTPGLAFHWWEQVGIYLLCLVPMALSFLIRDEPAAVPARAFAEEEALDSEADSAAIASTEQNIEEGDDPSTAEGVGEGGATDDAAAEAKQRRRRILLIGILVTAILIGVAVVTFATTSSALTARVTNSANTTGTRTYFTCRNAITSRPNGATGYLAYAMTPTTSGGSSTEADLSGTTNTGTYMYSPPSTAVSTACPRDNTRAVSFPGPNPVNTRQCLYTTTQYNNPSTFSLEAWFRTSTTSNGQLITFGNAQTGVGDTNHDRKIYIDRDGRVVFGLYSNNAVKIVYTAATPPYTDGQWHHVIATLSTSTDPALRGQRLYLDGNLAMANTAVTTAQNFSGYWKIGCGNLDSWQNAATAQAGNTGNYDYSGPKYFTGELKYVAAYPVALTAAQVKEHYLAGAN